jgi:hypothetical protein
VSKELTEEEALAMAASVAKAKRWVPAQACPPYKYKGVGCQDVKGVTGHYKGPLLKGGSMWPEDIANYYRDKETRFDR